MSLAEVQRDIPGDFPALPPSGASPVSGNFNRRSNGAVFGALPVSDPTQQLPLSTAPWPGSSSRSLRSWWRRRSAARRASVRNEPTLNGHPSFPPGPAPLAHQWASPDTPSGENWRSPTGPSVEVVRQRTSAETWDAVTVETPAVPDSWSAQRAGIPPPDPEPTQLSGWRENRTVFIGLGVAAIASVVAFVVPSWIPKPVRDFVRLPVPSDVNEPDPTTTTTAPPTTTTTSTSTTTPPTTERPASVTPAPVPTTAPPTTAPPTTAPTTTAPTTTSTTLPAPAPAEPVVLQPVGRVSGAVNGGQAEQFIAGDPANPDAVFRVGVDQDHWVFIEVLTSSENPVQTTTLTIDGQVFDFQSGAPYFYTNVGVGDCGQFLTDDGLLVGNVSFTTANGGSFTTSFSIGGRDIGCEDASAPEAAPPVGQETPAVETDPGQVPIDLSAQDDGSLVP